MNPEQVPNALSLGSTTGLKLNENLSLCTKFMEVLTHSLRYMKTRACWKGVVHICILGVFWDGRY